jgi:hypothetical protein
MDLFFGLRDDDLLVAEAVDVDDVVSVDDDVGTSVRVVVRLMMTVLSPDVVVRSKVLDNVVDELDELGRLDVMALEVEGFDELDDELDEKLDEELKELLEDDLSKLLEEMSSMDELNLLELELTSLDELVSPELIPLELLISIRLELE